jgi:Bifunctional DNA primase/polymerase, N-terminal
VFPCREAAGPTRKRPYTPRGFHDATADPDIIARWWTRWPEALVGMPTGRPSGRVVLDIDIKRPGVNGFDALEDLGRSILPETPMVHTASDGLHVYFAPPEPPIRNTAGSRGKGIGPGLDWRGEGGYVILPSPGSGYRWGDLHNFASRGLAEVPVGLLPREIRRAASPGHPEKPVTGLSPYAEAALDSACRKILAAPAGQQEATLNAESFSVGTLAGAAGIPEALARRTLIWAAAQIASFDPHRPWRRHEIEAKVDRAFDDGMRHPRAVRDAA